MFEFGRSPEMLSGCFQSTVAPSLMSERRQYLALAMGFRPIHDTSIAAIRNAAKPTTQAIAGRLEFPARACFNLRLRRRRTSASFPASTPEISSRKLVSTGLTPTVLRFDCTHAAGTAQPAQATPSRTSTRPEFWRLIKSIFGGVRTSPYRTVAAPARSRALTTISMVSPSKRLSLYFVSSSREVAPELNASVA